MNTELLNQIYNDAEIIHIYSYFEIPLTYISEMDNSLYFFHLIETLNHEDIWFFTPISDEEKNKLNSLSLHPRTLIISHLNQNLYKVITNFDNSVLSIENCENLNSEELPDESSEFDFDFLHNKLLTKDIALTEKLERAFSKHFNSFTLSFKDIYNSDLMPLNTLSNLALKISNIYGSINNGQLAVQAIPYGSFGLTLVPIGDSTRELDTCSTEAIDIFVETFKVISSDDVQTQQDFFNDLKDNNKNGLKIIDNLNDFLQEIDKKKLTFDLKDDTLNPIAHYKSDDIGVTKILDEIIKSSVEETFYENIEAILISFNSKTGHIRVSWEENEMSGYLEKEQFDSKVLITPSIITINFTMIADTKGKPKFILKTISNLQYYENNQSSDELVTNPTTK